MHGNPIVQPIDKLPDAHTASRKALLLWHYISVCFLRISDNQSEPETSKTKSTASSLLAGGS